MRTALWAGGGAAVVPVVAGAERGRTRAEATFWVHQDFPSKQLFEGRKEAQTQMFVCSVLADVPLVTLQWLINWQGTGSWSTAEPGKGRDLASPPLHHGFSPISLAGGAVYCQLPSLSPLHLRQAAPSSPAGDLNFSQPRQCQRLPDLLPCAPHPSSSSASWSSAMEQCFPGLPGPHDFLKPIPS
ncbi:hypothetical protein AV530_003947 [Patagioenas fasciata monilis]|uniref:Uncharacterized protein n=1 Tax=Patagioenas fasciata monilis TaxID=372326 RepID=A0A1V4KZ99_PATFA|nr:hypothetical protein AV530_003947 [Patagioenas fasciata monilis]